MDIRDLAYFESIAKLGSLGRAGDELGRTKPALSKCIARLEQEVGAPLFERTGRLMLLTEPGRILLDHAAQMQASMAHAMRHVAEQANGSRGHLRIGLGTSIVEFLLPPMSAWFEASRRG